MLCQVDESMHPNYPHKESSIMKITFRFLLLLALSLGFQSRSSAQFVTLPDPDFASALLFTPFSSCVSGNQLDTVCVQNYIVSNPTYPLDLTARSISDLTGIQYFRGLTNLKVSTNQLTSLPPLPTSLLYFSVDNNQLSSLPALPAGLLLLNCSQNLFTALPPSLPSGLQVLICNSNQLTSLPTLPSGLQQLLCAQNNLTSLPALPSTLTNLGCGNNQLSALPTLPSGLTTLTCLNNPLGGGLPVLPSSLVTLFCSNNQLTSLPTLPAGLQYLYAESNPITTLPVLPNSLKYLSAYNTGLNNLPILPAALETLMVYNTYITTLPQLPNGLRYLNCHNTLLDCSPLLPSSLLFIDYGSTNVPCLPNHPLSLTSGDITTLNLPICSPGSPCAPALPYVKGKAYVDYNNNCVMDGNDIPFQGRIVDANNQYFAITQSNGEYLMYLDTVSYSVNANIPSPLYQLNCPGVPYTGTFTAITDSLVNADFAYYPVAICPWLWVDIGQTSPRACQVEHTYVDYCNNGTDTAYNTYVEVTLDPMMQLLSSTLPYTTVIGNTYTFPVGTVAPGQCGSFLITDSVFCSALIDEAICVTAEIFPNNACNIPNSAWDQSHVELRAACTGSNIRFGIYNTGTGNMTVPSSYSIYEDHVLMINNASFQLPAGDSLIINLPVTHKTYQLDAQQTPNHPGYSFPRVFVEKCGLPTYSFGYITPVAQDDMDDFVEIDCQQLRNSYDPNHKYVQPEGVTSSHYILANDELEYTLTFQNTGNDTAYQVVITDTLDTQVLDVSTMVSGVSSHPYTLDVFSPGVLRWTFANINLPDSASNEAASQGFVKFKIRQQPNNPPGTVINNQVGIFFDYNAPIITNIATVTIQTHAFIFSVEYTDPQAKLQVNAYPNPFTDLLNIAVGGDQQFDDLRLEIRDLSGRLIISRENQGMQMQVNTSGLAAGTYLFTLIHQGRTLAAGKLVAQ